MAVTTYMDCVAHGNPLYSIAGYTHTAVAGELLLADLWGIELAGKQLGVLGLGRAMPFADQVSLSQLLGEPDVVGVAEIAMTKSSSILVSTSPEAIIDLDALPAALKDGRIAGAGLDFVEELPAQLALPNTVLSSRFGARTAECFAAQTCDLEPDTECLPKSTSVRNVLRANKVRTGKSVE